LRWCVLSARQWPPAWQWQEIALQRTAHPPVLHSPAWIAAAPGAGRQQQRRRHAASGCAHAACRAPLATLVRTGVSLALPLRARRCRAATLRLPVPNWPSCCSSAPIQHASTTCCAARARRGACVARAAEARASTSCFAG
jgi:hypothetical protein